MEQDPSQRAGHESRSPERQDSLSGFQRLGKFASKVGGVIHPRLGLAAGYMFGLSREQMGSLYDEKDKKESEDSSDKKTRWGRFKRGFSSLFGAHMVQDPRDEQSTLPVRQAPEQHASTSIEHAETPAAIITTTHVEAAQPAQEKTQPEETETRDYQTGPTRPSDTNREAVTTPVLEAEPTLSDNDANAGDTISSPSSTAEDDVITVEDSIPKDRARTVRALRGSVVQQPVPIAAAAANGGGSRDGGGRDSSVRGGGHAGGSIPTPYLYMDPAERAAFQYGQRVEAFQRRKKERLLATAAVIGGAAFLHERHKRKKTTAELTQENKMLRKRVAASEKKQQLSADTRTAAPRSEQLPLSQDQAAAPRANQGPDVIPIAVPGIVSRNRESAPVQPAVSTELTSPQRIYEAARTTSAPRSERDIEPALRMGTDRVVAPVQRADFTDTLPMIIPLVPESPEVRRSDADTLIVDRIAERAPDFHAVAELSPEAPPIPIPVPRPVEIRATPPVRPESAQLINHDVERLLARSREAQRREVSAINEARIHQNEIDKNAENAARILDTNPELLPVYVRTPEAARERQRFLEKIEHYKDNPSEILALLARPENRRLLTSQEILMIDRQFVKERQRAWSGFGAAGVLVGGAAQLAAVASRRTSKADQTSTSAKKSSSTAPIAPWPTALIVGFLLLALLYWWFMS